MPSYISGQVAGILPDGTYEFETTAATLRNSKNGNEMIEVINLIKDREIYDYLVFAEKSAWKIDQYRQATGDTILPGEHVVIEPSELIGRKGRCTIITEMWDGKPRNKIGSYIIAEEQDEIPGLKAL